MKIFEHKKRELAIETAITAGHDFVIMDDGMQDFNIKPDLTALGKIVGGGLPVGAYGAKSEIMQSLSPPWSCVPSRHIIG